MKVAIRERKAKWGEYLGLIYIFFLWRKKRKRKLQNKIDPELVLGGIIEGKEIGFLHGPKFHLKEFLGCDDSNHSN